MVSAGDVRGLLGQVRWFNLAILTITPAVGVYGVYTTRLLLETLIWSVAYYVISMLGITVGYHRLWSHRSYNASRPLQFLLCLMGASAVQGSVYWWARGHRSHHRYTDTPLDPYNANRGLFYTHIGWMLVKPTVKPGPADISDLKKDAVVQWQHRWYFAIIPVVGYALPAAIAGLGWGDWWGGWYYGFVLFMSPQSTFCINSIAHYIGESPFDDRKTARDHFLSGERVADSNVSPVVVLARRIHHPALLTMGEGYHNFHHQFPMDYRNAIKWYQFDPTKWFIAACDTLGLASHLRVFPENEIRKGELAMQLKKLKKVQDGIRWPDQVDDLPVVGWDRFKKESEERVLVIVSGFIHDVGGFLDEHPGGRAILLGQQGKDATAAFCGGVYEHGNAAYNLLSMMRVGVLHGGVEHVKAIAPGERLRIVERLN